MTYAELEKELETTLYDIDQRLIGAYAEQVEDTVGSLLLARSTTLAALVEIKNAS